MKARQVLVLGLTAVAAGLAYLLKLNPIDAGAAFLALMVLLLEWRREGERENTLRIQLATMGRLARRSVEASFFIPQDWLDGQQYVRDIMRRLSERQIEVRRTVEIASEIGGEIAVRAARAFSSFLHFGDQVGRVESIQNSLTREQRVQELKVALAHLWRARDELIELAPYEADEVRPELLPAREQIVTPTVTAKIEFATTGPNP